MTNNILNNIDTKEVWIDVETVAKLKDITKRAVRLSLSNDKYEYKVKTVKGGKTYKNRRIQRNIRKGAVMKKVFVKTKKRETINLDDEPPERKRRRSPRNGACLW